MSPHITFHFSINPDVVVVGACKRKYTVVLLSFFLSVEQDTLRGQIGVNATFEGYSGILGVYLNEIGGILTAIFLGIKFLF